MNMSSSSLAFPTEDEDEGQYYSAAFDTSASFTMNPHSMHPPRTPHQSVTKRESIYSTQSGSEKRQSVHVEVEVEEDDSHSEAGAEDVRVRRVPPEEIWRDMLLSSNGRDKAFKLIQYSLKTLLLINRRVSLIPFYGAIGWRLEKTVAGLSFTRKLLLLFNWLGPLTAVLKLQSANTKKSEPFLHTLLHAPPPVLLELVNALADDLHAYALLGLLPKRMGERAARMADWCWFLSTIVALVENALERSVVNEVEGRVYDDEMQGVPMSKNGPVGRKRKVDEKEVRRIEYKSYWLQVTRAKLLLDLVFVSWDLWRIKRGKDVVKTMAGLGAAVLSSMKLVEKHRAKR